MGTSMSMSSRRRKNNRRNHRNAAAAADENSDRPRSAPTIPAPRASCHKLYAHDEQLAELVCAVGCVRATLANALIDARDWADAADAASRAGTSEGTGSKGKGKKKRDKPRDDDLRDARRSRERDMLDRVVSDASERPEMSKELRSSMKLEHTAREWAGRVREQARVVADFAKEFAKTCETLNADCENTFAISLEASLREHEETWIAHDVAKKRFEKLSAVREKSKSTDTVERRADLDEASTRLSSLVAQMNALEELIKLRSMNFTVYFRPQIVHLMRLFAVNQCQKFEEANAVVAATLADDVDDLRRVFAETELPSKAELECPPTPPTLGSPRARSNAGKMDSPTTPLDKESVTSSELEEGEIAPELDSE